MRRVWVCRVLGGERDFIFWRGTFLSDLIERGASATRNDKKMQPVPYQIRKYPKSIWAAPSDWNQYLLNKDRSAVFVTNYLLLLGHNFGALP